MSIQMFSRYAAINFDAPARMRYKSDLALTRQDPEVMVAVG